MLLAMLVFGSIAAFPQNAIGDRFFFLSNRSLPERFYTLYMGWTGRTDTVVNLSTQLGDVTLRSSAIVRLNHARNSLLVTTESPRQLIEIVLEPISLRTVTPLAYEATTLAISPDGACVLLTDRIDSLLQIVEIELATGSRRNLSSNAYNNREASYVGDGSVIVYVCDRDGTNSIAVMKRDGSGQRLLTNAFGEDREPRSSPDGRSIVFRSSRGGTTDADHGIWMINVDGSSFRSFYDTPGFESAPQFSPDGKSVLLSSTQRGLHYRDLVLVDTSGSNAEIITNSLKFFHQNAQFSFDGSQILFEESGPVESDIYVYDIHSRNMLNLTHHVGRNCVAAW